MTQPRPGRPPGAAPVGAVAAAAPVGAVAAAAGPVAAQFDFETDEDDLEKGAGSVLSNAQRVSLYRAWRHIWAKDDTHWHSGAWRSGPQPKAFVLDALGIALNKTQCYDHVAKEVAAYVAGKGYRERPNVTASCCSWLTASLRRKKTTRRAAWSRRSRWAPPLCLARATTPN